MTTSISDVAKVVDSIVGTPSWNTLSFTLGVPPMPCPRPRLTRGGIAYMPKRYTEWRDLAIGDIPTDTTLSGPIACGLLFVMAPPKTVKRTYPRYDIDNYTKSVLDLITKTGAVWDDDDQVTVCCAWKRFTQGDEEPYVHVYLREVE